MLKQIIYTTIVLIIVSLATNIGYIEVYAAGGTSTTSGTGTIIDTDKYKPDSNTEAGGADRVQNFANMIIGVIQVVGTIISVAVLIVLGIKYMAGGVEERAEYKKTMMPYVIGALLVFGITNILGIVSNITDGLL